MYNPVLFLDIDGVLNSEKWYEYVNFNKTSWYNEKCLTKRMIKHCIDDKAVQLINYICDKTNAQIVISSTWRYGRTVEFLQQILNDRGYEIDAWISKNRSKDENGDYFKFTNYVILDDDIGDMLIKQNDNVFEINRRTGITKEDANVIIEFLNKGVEYNDV